MVGRYRSCRDADLRDPFAVSPGMAHGGEPRCGSDDHFCGDVCGSVPDLAYGTGLDGFLCDALPEHKGTAMAELQLPPSLGRVRHLHLFHRLPFILVYRSDTRSGGRPGPGQTEMEEVVLRDHLFWLVRVYQALAASRGIVSRIGRSEYTAGAFRTHDRVVRLRHLRYPRLAYDDLPALLCRRRHLFRVCHGADAIAGHP